MVAPMSSGTFYAFVAAVFAFEAFFMAFLIRAHRSDAYAGMRIKAGASGVPARSQKRIMGIIALISPAYFLGVVTLGGRWLMHDASVSILRVVLEVVGVLMVYDFTYYFFHRVLHHRKLFQLVHGVHHRARNPSALESLYQHPLELLGGLTLLFLSTLVVGPVARASFLVVFFIYSSLNVFIHSGLIFGSPALKIVDVLTRRHHVHHLEDVNKNFASITPLPDWIFRTAR
jgi:sterol desaturase/sphingolipid hydroxylase (fatty acid hydroxylase superfamily)